MIIKLLRYKNQKPNNTLNCTYIQDTPNRDLTGMVSTERDIRRTAVTISPRVHLLLSSLVVSGRYC